MMKIEDLAVGESLPERKHQPSNVSLFLYNAAVWNAHRIHYDERYTREEEGHPDVVVDGPLQGDWLAQCVDNWLDSVGVLETFEYSNRRAAYLGETLVSGGEIKTIDLKNKEVRLELWVKNSKGEVISPGKAQVSFFE